jgi:Enterobacter phage Enc34, ssDNA-binding protein
MPDTSNTKVMTGKVRLSYVHVWEPYTSNPGKNEPKYSVTLVIPKEDTETLARLRAAQQAALEAGKERVFKGRIPKNWTDTIHDGDEEADLEKNPEYEGCYYLGVSSKTRPAIADRQANPILDQTEVYSGCYARVKLGAFAYNNSGNQGVSFGLDGLQKLDDGEPLGGAVSMRAEDFEAIEEDSLI